MSLLSHGRSGLLWAAAGLSDGRSGSLWGKAGAAQTMVKSDAPAIVVMVVVVVLPVITIILPVRHGASNSRRPRSRHVFSSPSVSLQARDQPVVPRQRTRLENTAFARINSWWQTPIRLADDR